MSDFQVELTSVVDQIIANEKLNRDLITDIVRSKVSWFCCGEAGGTTEYDVPKKILVCPLFGSDAIYTYELKDPKV